MALSASFAACSAHLEDIGEIVVETKCQRCLNRMARMIGHANPLEAMPIPQDAGPEDMYRSARYQHMTFAHHVRVRQVDGENRVVVADGGT
jgi:hypothetical protein